MLIPRIIEQNILKDIGKQKVILLFGTRRTGKSTIIKNIASLYGKDALTLDGEDMTTANILQNRTATNYQQIATGKKLIMIDEAQAVPNIGQILKLFIDTVTGITIIATGSSSFDLQYREGEPLVGRNITYYLFPISQSEINKIQDNFKSQLDIENRLIYGSYPEIWHMESNKEKEQYLKQIITGYLLKDILIYENVKGANVLYKLLQLIAWQVGSLVNTSELSKNLQISRGTVDRYLDLLSKVYIIYSLSSYSNNPRKEISKSKKWFFYDNGIRNALISNFNSVKERNDIGQLWEQYFLYERIKFNNNNNDIHNYYFWRNYDGAEIDLIESDNYQNIKAFKCKWNIGSSKVKMPVSFKKLYPQSPFNAVDKTNFLAFVS